MRMRKQANGVIGGVDTHKDSHAVVALDSTGHSLNLTPHNLPVHEIGSGLR